jgi:hypothetical protein
MKPSERVPSYVVTDRLALPPNCLAGLRSRAATAPPASPVHH